MQSYKILWLFILILFSRCSQPSKEMETESAPVLQSDEISLTEAQHKSVGISLGNLEEKELSGVVKANGMLDVPPQNMVTVSAMLGGFVKHTEMLQGMTVKKGQVIAIMEHPDYIQLQQDYLESKSQLTFYEAELNRQQELAKENINAAKSLQQAESNYHGTKARVEGLKARLKLININADNLDADNIRNTINIYAPISGFVTQVHVNIGMYVNPADVLFKIVDTRHLHAEIIVFEKDALKIKMGQKVTFQLSNETTKRTAKVYMIGKEIGPERTIRVHCHLENEDEALIPGMYLSALFETGSKKSSALPEQAVINFEGDNYIFLAVNEVGRRYKMLKVRRGIVESGYAEVILPDEVDPSSKFVIAGAYDLLGYLKNTEEE